MTDELGRPAHESSDLPARRVVLVGLGFAALVPIALGAIAVTVAVLQPRATPDLPLTALEVSERGPPAPRLQEDPSAELDRLEESRVRLHGFGWVDREAGIAHIPIDAAMDLLAKRGWPHSDPDRAPGAAGEGVDPGRQMPPAATRGALPAESGR